MIGGGERGEGENDLFTCVASPQVKSKLDFAGEHFHVLQFCNGPDTGPKLMLLQSCEDVIRGTGTSFQVQLR